MSGKITVAKPQYNKENVEKIVRYANYSEVNPTEIGPTDGLAFMAGAELMGKGKNWWSTNKGHRVQSFKQTLTPNLSKTKDFVIDFKKNPGSTLMTGYRQQKINSMLKSTPKAPVIPEGAAVTTKIQNAQVVADKYKDVRRLLEEAQTLKGDALKTATKNIEIAQAQAKYNAHLAKMNGEIKPINTFGKVKRYVAKKSGASAIKSKYLKTAANSSKLRTLSKCAKGGNALFAVASAGVAGLEVYNTYKTLGKESGNKQLVKSTVNTAADVGGWILGAKAGAVAGAAIGSCIPVPVVGTVVGAIVGVGCGLLGSWLAGKAARAVTGPSEIELAEKKQAELAMNDPEVMNNLLGAAAQRCTDELSSGVVSEDTQSIAVAYDDVYETFLDQNQELMADADTPSETQESAATQNVETDTRTEESSAAETVEHSAEHTATQEEYSTTHSQSSSTSLLADAGSKSTEEERAEEANEKSEQKSSSDTKVKNKELSNILARLSALVGYNPSVDATYTSGFNPIMPMPFGFGYSSMPTGFGFNPMMNNFNLFPQFGYMA